MKHDSAIDSRADDRATTGFAVFDEDDRLLEANSALLGLGDKAVAKLHGKDSESIIKLFLGNLVSVDDQPVKSTKTYLKQFISNWSAFAGMPIEAETSDGQWKLLTSHPRPGGGKALI
ncbi:MAG: hypothetical protein ACR2OM_03820, partial [Aestuariivirgaceae bacterium]